MIVVSDTSAITNLAAVNQLALLHQLYGKVVIPEAVYAELTGPPLSIGGMEAREYDWIQVQGASDRKMVEECLNELDIGEAEAIALAIELNSDLLLLDEREAREFAEAKGLKNTGVL